MAATPHPLGLSADTAPQLSFAVAGAAAERHSASPVVNLALRVEREGGGPVRSVLLDTQVRIAAQRRGYTGPEQALLGELFGTPDRWGTTLRSLLWTRVTLVVPPFTDATEVTLPVPCSYDLEASAADYLSGLEGGEVPLELLFSGSVFYAGPGGMLQTARIAWDREADYRLPVAVWQEAMDRHFPGAAWLRLSRQAFDGLRAHKLQRGLRTLDEAVLDLLKERG
jgi:hypothetical protein